MWKLKAIITNSGLCLGASLLWLTSMLGLLASTSLAQSMQELKLTVGKSVVIDYPEDIGRISTSAPEVADCPGKTSFSPRSTDPLRSVRNNSH